MAVYSLFVSVEDIKATGIVDENVDDKIIRDAILNAQRIYVRDIIGSGIYDELDTQKQAGTLTAYNTTLLSKMKDCLVYWSIFEGLDSFQYKIRNKAVMKSNSDNSQPIDTDELVRLAEKYRNRAEYYSTRLKEYLMENCANYPLYYSPGTTVDTIHPKKDTYFSGWVMKRRPIDNGDNDINKMENPNTYC